MTPRTTRLNRCSIVFWTFALLAVFSESAVRADPLYTITDLGTLSGQSSSVATSINNQGQVVGISYNSSDGYFAADVYGQAMPPRFSVAGDGAQSFLYSGGQLTSINPTGGLAMSINNSGQVVGGPYSSVNDAGQYVGGGASGIVSPNYQNVSDQLVSGGTTTTLSYFGPYAINNAGQIAGTSYPSAGVGISNPAVYQNGVVTNLSSIPGAGQYGGASNAIAINQHGDVLVTVWQQGETQSYLYHASTGVATDLTTLPGGSGFIAAALNSADQAVGNGFLYSNNSIETLLSLLPAGSGWTNLNATAINDAGQIVGQGTYDGQQVAFLMTPDAEAPEPGALAVWCLMGAFAVRQLAKRRSMRKHAN